MNNNPKYGKRFSFAGKYKVKTSEQYVEFCKLYFTYIDRIKKMESDGIIYDYTARVDYRKMGFDMVAFVGIVMDNPVYIDDFENIFKNVDEDIVECYHVTGDFTLLLKVITKNTNTLAGIVRKLRELPGVASTNTILVFSTMVNRVHKI